MRRVFTSFALLLFICLITPVQAQSEPDSAPAKYCLSPEEAQQLYATISTRIETEHAADNWNDSSLSVERSRIQLTVTHPGGAWTIGIRHPSDCVNSQPGSRFCFETDNSAPAGLLTLLQQIDAAMDHDPWQLCKAKETPSATPAPAEPEPELEPPKKPQPVGLPFPLAATFYALQMLILFATFVFSLRYMLKNKG